MNAEKLVESADVKERRQRMPMDEEEGVRRVGRLRRFAIEQCQGDEALADRLTRQEFGGVQVLELAYNSEDDFDRARTIIKSLVVAERL